MMVFFKSFIFAFRGIREGFKVQRNILVMLSLAILVIGLACYLKLDINAFSLIVLTSGIVFSLEIINTVLERLIDRLHPETHSTIAQVKDMLAGAVLIMSICALIVGLLLLGPALWNKIQVWRVK